ncbi:MAG: DUF4352 domain-containing protein [Chloroflexi bacterium]|nr:DUF4352 domain-containing protein [Chloroflexota bacterium]
MSMLSWAAWGLAGFLGVLALTPPYSTSNLSPAAAGLLLAAGMAIGQNVRGIRARIPVFAQGHTAAGWLVFGLVALALIATTGSLSGSRPAAQPELVRAAADQPTSSRPVAVPDAPTATVTASIGETEAETAAAPSGPTTYNVGDTVKLGDWELTVSKVQTPFVSSNRLSQPELDHFALVYVQLTNVGNEPLTINPASFKLRTEDGQVYSMGSVVREDDLSYDTVVPGDKIAGSVAFDLPNSGRYRVYFAPSELRGQQAIIEVGEL